MVTQSCTGFAQGDDFGMGGGVVVGDVAIPAAADDALSAHDYSAYRNFAGFERALGGAQSFLHPEFVVSELVDAVGQILSEQCAIGANPCAQMMTAARSVRDRSGPSCRTIQIRLNKERTSVGNHGSNRCRHHDGHEQDRRSRVRARPAASGFWASSWRDRLA